MYVYMYRYVTNQLRRSRLLYLFTYAKNVLFAQVARTLPMLRQYVWTLLVRFQDFR